MVFQQDQWERAVHNGTLFGTGNTKVCAKDVETVLSIVQVADIPLHFQFVIYSNTPGILKVYEDVEFTGGTPIHILNFNRVAKRDTTVINSENPTTVTSKTMMLGMTVFEIAMVSPINREYPVELVLAPNTNYMWTFTPEKDGRTAYYLRFIENSNLVEHGG